jgi:hypothetical protein
MKNLLTTLSFAFFALTVSNIALFAQFGGGNGLTVATAYQIYTKAHLEELSDSIIYSPSNNNTTGKNWSRDKHFKVMNDIIEPLTKIIGWPASWSSFQGHFDGQNYTITLDINDATFYYVGLFNCIYYGSIKNVVVTGSINAINQYYNVGGIVGGIITGDSASGDVRISNCVNNANVMLANYFHIAGAVGGIVGGIGVSGIRLVSNEVIIENCINIGSVKGFGTGGILGASNVNIAGVCIINNCVNYGLIAGDIWAGGIAGIIDNRITISNCYNSGVVSGSGNVGCIVGNNAGGTVINCHYDMQMCDEE